MDPVSGVEARTTIGGASPVEVERQIEEQLKILKADEQKHEELTNNISNAKSQLHEATDQILSLRS
jgi:DNA repair ATPase RecN